MEISDESGQLSAVSKQQTCILKNKKLIAEG